jgi:hypothetical protein
MECYLQCVSFALCLYSDVMVLVLIGRFFQQSLPENVQRKKVAESVQAARHVELEVLVKSQVEKIAELKVAYADLKREKENITAGYQKNTRRSLTRRNMKKQSLPKPMRRS